MTDKISILEKEIANRREGIRTAMRTGVVSISFEKADGSIREMKATTNEVLINQSLSVGGLPLLGEDYVPEEYDENQSYHRVFDLEIKEWRGFVWYRLESATSDSLGIL